MKIWMKMALLVGAAVAVIAGLTTMAVGEFRGFTSSTLDALGEARAAHEWGREMANAYSRYGVAFARLSTVKSPVQFEYRVDQIHEAQTDVLDLAEVISRRAPGKELATFETMFRQFTAEVDAFLADVARTGKPDAATVDTLAGQFEKMVQPLMAASRAIDERSLERVEAARATADDGVRTMLVAGVGVGAGILLFGTFLSVTIVRRVRRLTAVSDKLTAGEIEGLAVDVGGHDEIGDLGDSMERAVAAFQLLFEEVERNASAPAQPAPTPAMGAPAPLALAEAAATAWETGEEA